MRASIKESVDFSEILRATILNPSAVRLNLKTIVN